MYWNNGPYRDTEQGFGSKFGSLTNIKCFQIYIYIYKYNFEDDTGFAISNILLLLLLLLLLCTMQCNKRISFKRNKLNTIQMLHKNLQRHNKGRKEKDLMKGYQEK